MSGIVCVLNTDGAPLAPGLLRGLTDSMAFRGPDAQETWRNGSVGLGHATLRIAPEDEGSRQPFSLDDQVWMTADVRLDARSELLRAVRSAGRQAGDDAPDAELLLHAYHLWGESCLDRVTGDFAFVIWDSRRSRLLCAHDQCGVVPLYYAVTEGALIVSNTLPCVRAHPDVSGELNEQAIADLLLAGMNLTTTTTTFTAIRRLAPGERLSWSPERTLWVERYWSPAPTERRLNPRAGKEYSDRFRDLFTEAVADRIRTDAVGTHLSGGLDASSIAVTAHRLLRNADRAFDLRAYTIEYRDLIPDDEGRYAREVATHDRLSLEVLVGEEFITRAPPECPTKLPPEPLLLPGAEGEIQSRVASFARVMLVGFGGDPLLEYDESSLGGLAALGSRLRSAVRRLTRPSGSPSGVAVPDGLEPDFATRLDLDERFRPGLAVFSERRRVGMASNPLWSNIFAWSDPGFTGLPLRVHFPFFDLRLLSYTARVPPMRQKELLRHAMRTDLPQSVLRRPKSLLAGDPYWSWFQREGLASWAIDLLHEPALAPYVSTERMRDVLRRSDTLTQWQLREFGRLLPLAYWLRHDGSTRHHLAT